MKQKDVLEFQMMSSELNQVQEFLGRIDEQVGEVNSLIASLDDFGNLAQGSDILFPIANGIFAEGKVTNTKTLKVNVGRGVVVTRTVEETNNLVKEQLENLREQQKAAMDRQDELYTKLQELEVKVSSELGKKDV